MIRKYNHWTILDAKAVACRILARCDCGNQRRVLLKHLKSGASKSCGCVSQAAAHVTHGMSHTPTYNSWNGMRLRCYNPRHPSYSRYGARGIKVCPRWMRFENFLEDMGPRPEGKTLDRKNNSRGYSKSNCRWATPVEQRANQG